MKKYIPILLLVLCLVLIFAPCMAQAAYNVSFTAIDGTAGKPGESYTNLFDGNAATKWCVQNYTSEAEVIIKASRKVIISEYTFTTANDTAAHPTRNPKAWTLYGATDFDEATLSAQWYPIAVHEVTDGQLPTTSNTTSAPFTLNTSEALSSFQYYKLVITENCGAPLLQLGGITFKCLGGDGNSVPDEQSITLGTSAILPGESSTYIENRLGNFILQTMGSWDTVFFGTYNGKPLEWRVLSKNGSTSQQIEPTTYKDASNAAVSENKAMFLLSEHALAEQKFHDEADLRACPWTSSDARTWCQNAVNTIFSATEQKYLLKTSKTDVDFSGFFYYTGEPAEAKTRSWPSSGNIKLEDDILFFPSASEVAAFLSERDTSNFLTDAMRTTNLSNQPVAWWIRSIGLIPVNATMQPSSSLRSGPFNAYFSADTIASHELNYSATTDIYARPAMNVDQSQILFTTAVQTGKLTSSIGTLVKPATLTAWNNQNQYQLTLRDSAHNNFSVSKTEITASRGSYIEIPYSNAKSGTNEYISVMLTDASNTVVYYGPIKAVSAASDQNGRIGFNLPTDLNNSSYTLKVFNEQINGAKKTDYAGDFQNIALTILPMKLTETALPATIEYDDTFTVTITPSDFGSGYSAADVSYKWYEGQTVLSTENSYTYHVTDLNMHTLKCEVSLGTAYTALREFSFTPTKKILGANDFTFTPTTAVYNGNNQEVTVTPNYAQITDFTVKYYPAGSSNSALYAKNAATYTVKLTAAESEISAATTQEIELGTFTVTPKPITDATVVITPLSYDGSEKAAAAENITITVDDTALVCGTDYTIDCTAQTTPGTYPITLNGKGNYQGSKAADWVIEKGTATALGGNSLVVYNKQTAYYGVLLTSFLDNRKSYGNIQYAVKSTDLGNYTTTAPIIYNQNYLSVLIDEVNSTAEGNIGTIVVTVSSDYYKDFDLTISVQATNKLASSGEPILSLSEIVYGDTLSTIRLSGTMTYGMNTVQGTFEWIHPNETPNASENYSAAWKFTPSSAVYDTVTGTSTIQVRKKNIANATIEIPQNAALTYNGTAQTQTVSVTLQGYPNITFAVENNVQTNVNANGKYTLTVKGTGNFEGEKDFEWNILPASPILNPNKPITAVVKKGKTLADATVTEGEFFALDGQTALPYTRTWVNPNTIISYTNGTEPMTVVFENPNYKTITADVAINGYASSTSNSNTGNSGGGGDATPKTTYTVTFNTNGGSPVNSITVEKNQTVAQPSAPQKEAFTFDGWYTDSKLTTAYSFNTKVTKSLTLYAKWIKEEPQVPQEDTNNPQQPQNGTWENNFTDVSESDWFFESIQFAMQNGFMQGTTENEFAPHSPLTRGMLVTTLWRISGKPQVNYAMLFNDVDAESYYAEAVRWAASEKIVSGTTEDEFSPDANITREQIAVMLYRYAKHMNYDVSVGESTNILSYTDFSTISEYAIEAMQYAVGSGLIKGKTSSTLNPKDLATRAEIATVLQRFIENNR